MKTTTPIPWSDIRAEYMSGRWRSFRAFAEANDVSYHAVLRRARAEEWKRLRRLHVVRTRLRCDEARLEAKLKEAEMAARDVLACVRSRRKLTLDVFARLGYEAEKPISQVWSAAMDTARSRAELADMERGGNGEIEAQPFPYPGAPKENTWGPYEPVLVPRRVAVRGH